MFKWIIILNTYAISWLIQDLMVVITYVIRGISLKLLSPNFMLFITANWVYFILAINFIYVYFTEYNINRTLTWSEEKYNKMMISTLNDSVGSYSETIFLVFYLGGRILYQFVYILWYFKLCYILWFVRFNVFISTLKFCIYRLLFFNPYFILLIENYACYLFADFSCDDYELLDCNSVRYLFIISYIGEVSSNERDH